MACFFLTSVANALTISGAKTLSKSAKYISVMFSVSEDNADCFANVYQGEWPNNSLDHASMTIPSDTPAMRIMDVSIPDAALAGSKDMVIECSASSGVVVMHHKITAPPAIRLSSSLSMATMENIHINANTYIDNHEPDGVCYVNQFPRSVNLLGGEPGETKRFFADYFSFDKLLPLNQARYIQISLVCQNSGGVTIANHAWEVQGDEVVRVNNSMEYH